MAAFDWNHLIFAAVDYLHRDAGRLDGLQVPVLQLCSSADHVVHRVPGRVVSVLRQVSEQEIYITACMSMAPEGSNSV